MKRVYLPKTDICLWQDEKVLPLNTDTVLLGESLDFPKGKTVLDIGTSTGALLLYASKLKPASLTGVDIDSHALEIARKNLDDNAIEAKLINCDIREYHGLQYDIIICNPPFFKGTNTALKSDDYLPLDDLFLAFRRLIKDNGHIYIIYQATRLPEVIEACLIHGFKIKTIRFVYNQGSEAIRFLAKLKRGKDKTTRIAEPITLKHP